MQFHSYVFIFYCSNLGQFIDFLFFNPINCHFLIYVVETTINEERRLFCGTQRLFVGNMVILVDSFTFCSFI